MTLHTLLEGNLHAIQIPVDNFIEDRGLTVRDTVNQWLEATVVEVLKPHEILPVRS
jgi:hypothetical protein